jgi:hypothetical protein
MAAEGRLERTGASDGDDGRAIDPDAEAGSRTVMTFAQVLQRTRRSFPRTFSSAMEYLV